MCSGKFIATNVDLRYDDEEENDWEEQQGVPCSHFAAKSKTKTKTQGAVN